MRYRVGAMTYAEGFAHVPQHEVVAAVAHRWTTRTARLDQLVERS